MDNKSLEKLKELRKTYSSAISICDPITFQQRQKILLYEMCEFLLLELDEYEDSKNS